MAKPEKDKPEKDKKKKPKKKVPGEKSENLEGVNELLKSPVKPPKSSSKRASAKPAKTDAIVPEEKSTNLEGVNELLKSPVKPPKSPSKRASVKPAKTPAKKEKKKRKDNFETNDFLEDSCMINPEGPPIGEIVAHHQGEADDVSAILEVITDDVGGQEGLDDGEIIYNPEDFDVCFDNKGHPGTKEWMRAVRDSLEEFGVVEYSPPIYKAIKKNLKGRRFLIRISRNHRTSWREGSKPEVIEIIGEYFEKLQRRKAEGLPLEYDDVSEVDSTSLQDSGKQSEGSISVGEIMNNSSTKNVPASKQTQPKTKKQPKTKNQPEKQDKSRMNGQPPASTEHRPSEKTNGRKSPLGVAREKENQMLAMAIGECERAQEYAKPFDDMSQLQRGVAAEQKLGMLLSLASTPHTPGLRGELVLLEDLAKRMRYASMAPMLDSLERIEKHVTEFFQSLVGESLINQGRQSSDLPPRSPDAKDGAAVHNRSIPIASVHSIEEIPEVNEDLSASDDAEEYEAEEASEERRPTGETENSGAMAAPAGVDFDQSYFQRGDEPSEAYEENSMSQVDAAEEEDDDQDEQLGESENAHFLHLDGSEGDDLSSVGVSQRDYDEGDSGLEDDDDEYEELEVDEDEEEYPDEGDESEQESENSSSDGSEGEPKVSEPKLELDPLNTKEPLNPKVEQFFDRLQHFFEVRRKVEERADLMDPSDKIKNLKLKLHSGGIKKKNGNFKVEYQQHDIKDKLVSNIDDVYEAAQHAHPELQKILDQLMTEVTGFDTSSCIIAQLKPRDRAFKKTKEEYADRKPGPPESWLYDVVRASVICKSYKQMSDVNKWLGKKLHVVQSKNRFAEPAFNGYRDMLFHVSLPFRDETAHICEIQVHHKDMKGIEDQFGMPKHRELFRSIFAGARRSQEDTLTDLTLLNKHGAIGGKLLAKLMRSKEPQQLRLFAGICHEKLDEFDRALELYRRLLIMQEDSVGRDHESVAHTYLSIGLVLGMLGETDESLLNLQKALAIQETILGTDHLEVAESYAEIGRMRSKKGDFGGALEEHRKAKGIRESKLGKEHFLVIASLQDIGRALQEKGDFKGSVAEYRKALKIQQSVLGVEHTDVAATHALIGSALCQQGDFDSAMEEHKRALSIRETGMGKNHPMTAESHTDIGIVLCQKGDYEVSEWRHRKALRIREAMRGKEHEDCALSYSQLGLVLSKKGDFETALKEIHRALKIRENTLGRDHPLTACSFIDLGDVLWRQGSYDEALHEYRRAMVIRESMLGERHPDTASAYNCIGTALKHQGKYDAALVEHRRALEILEAVLGKNHPITATGYQCVADTLLAKGDNDEALIEQRKALAIRASVLAKDHPDTATSCTSIGTLMFLKGDLVGALVAYRQALAIQVGLCGADHLNTASAHICVGRALTAKKDLDDALEALKQAASIREASLGKDSVDTATAYSLVGSVMSMKGLFEEAEVAHETALSTRLAKLGETHPATVASNEKVEMASIQKSESELEP
jgi:tetratricopeptide (TPR) repeat protein